MPDTPTTDRRHTVKPTPDRPAPKRRTPVIGKRTELARYTVAEGERILYSQRIDGLTRILDRPATPGRRAYLVEDGVQSTEELDAIVGDYLEQAQRMNMPPLAITLADRHQDAIA